MVRGKKNIEPDKKETDCRGKKEVKEGVGKGERVGVGKGKGEYLGVLKG